jgi:hypothetical protein
MSAVRAGPPDVDRRIFASPRRNHARVLLNNAPRKQRAQGKPDALSAPAASCAKEKAHEFVTTGLPERPGFPCTVVLTASFVLSPVIGLSCHRRRRIILPT